MSTIEQSLGNMCKRFGISLAAAPDATGPIYDGLAQCVVTKVEAELYQYAPGSELHYTYGDSLKDNNTAVRPQQVDEFIWEVLGRIGIQRDSDDANTAYEKVKTRVEASLAEKAAKFVLQELMGRINPSQYDD